MSQKLTVSIDLTKVDKDRIRVEEYTNRDGEKVVKKMYDIDVIPLKPENHKTIASGPTWSLRKTHFVTDSATKEERAEQKKMTTLGEAKQFINQEQNDAVYEDPSQMPF